MGKISNLLWGAAIGAGMMYFMDPEQGNRRKALVRDQVYKLRSRSDEALETAVNDLRNRTRGILAEGMSMLSNEAKPERGLNVSQLQEEGKMPASGQWSPSTRLIAGTGAGYLLLYSAVRGGFIGFVARLGGLFLGARALTNMNARQLTGRGIEQGIIDVRKTIQINAPVEEVYELWSNFDNFSRFMQNIESVRMTGDRSHWVVKGPAGSKVEFDAITTAMAPNELVSWETTPDSMVKHQGRVRFRESGDGTQVNVNMTYTPPAGAVGHAVASLFGKDPKTEMDADLMRMKSLLEKGRTRTGGQKVTREEIAGTGTSTGKQSGQKQQEKSANTSAVPVTGSQDDEASQTTVHGRTKDDSPMSGEDISEKIRRDMGGGEENSPGGQNRH